MWCGRRLTADLFHCLPQFVDRHGRVKARRHLDVGSSCTTHKLLFSRNVRSAIWMRHRLLVASRHSHERGTTRRPIDPNRLEPSTIDFLTENIGALPGGVAEEMVSTARGVIGRGLVTDIFVEAEQALVAQINSTHDAIT